MEGYIKNIKVKNEGDATTTAAKTHRFLTSSSNSAITAESGSDVPALPGEFS